MEEFLNMKYRLSKSENFDQFMCNIGMGFMARKIVGVLTPTVDLSMEDDEYTLTTYSSFRTMTMTFKLGEEFDEVKPDGTVWKTVFTLEGNKLIQKQNGLGKDVTITREFTAKEMKVVMTVGDVVCTRSFIAV